MDSDKSDTIRFFRKHLKTSGGVESFIKHLMQIGQQCIHTPFDLCLDMLGELSEHTSLTNKSIGVLFNVEFLHTLVDGFGVNIGNICMFAEDDVEYEFCRLQYNMKPGIDLFKIDIDKTVETNTLYTNEGKFDMQFDVVVMNPPYQVQTETQKTLIGNGSSQARPLYPSFIELAIDTMKPNFLLSVNPSRWMIGVMGMDDFLQRMKKDKHIKMINHVSREDGMFPDVKIKGGTNYFIWDKNYSGPCKFTSDGITVNRDLDEFDIVPQDNKSISILKKVMDKSKKWVSQTCLGRKPFGLSTNHSDWQETGTPCYYIGNKVGKVNEFTDNNSILDKWKVATSKGGSPNEDSNGQKTVISNIFIIEPNAICTETYIIVNVFDTKKEADNFISYMRTKFFRFMLGLRALTQDINKNKFSWVPDLDNYSQPISDNLVYGHFELTQDEQDYIESKIK